MKQFPRETVAPAALAAAVTEVAWRVLQRMKTEIGRSEPLGLTFTQMRALGFLHGSPGASLSELAEDLGLQKPTASKVVEELVQQGRVVREVVPDNRRKLALHVTASGLEALGAAAAPALASIAELLVRLTPEERETVVRAMALLHPLFLPRAAPERSDNLDAPERRSA